VATLLSTDEVKTAIEAALAGSEAFVTDMTGTSDHFDAIVVWDGFDGMTRVRQHQAVYAALGDAMHGPVHALKLRTVTQAEWQAER
jgi:acid stress-induced BolA-like protein IbaG/YrbA